MQANIEIKIKEAELNLQRKLDWVSRHDTRTMFIAGISIAMLGVLSDASASIICWSIHLYIIFGISLIALFASLILVYCSQYPKTKSKNKSLVFFGTIAKMKADDFVESFKKMTPEKYLDDLLFQTHINAEILNKKFEYLKASLVVIIISVIPWIVAIYQSKVYLK